jgi:Raf kinase inhibitor-like YbhB/YbcL family protein
MRILISLIFGLYFSAAVYAADFNISSAGFSDNTTIPPIYSCDGNDISPPLSWSNAPEGTKSFALILKSPDWSAGLVYLWIVYNIPNTMTSLTEGANRNLPDGISVGTNYYNETTYRGPCPPDSLSHHYVFTLYALDTLLDLPTSIEGDDFLLKINSHIIQQTSLTGVFKH